MVNFNEEKKLWRRGFECVAGLDEAGRGPLAGPVVAAAVMINPKHEIRNPKQVLNLNFQNSKHVSSFDIRISSLVIDDSKKLSEKKREEIYQILTNHHSVEWGVGTVSEKTIDKINILEATKLAMKKSIESLQKKYTLNYEGSEFRVCVENMGFLLIDGNFGLQTKIPQKSVIKGDQKVFSIAAASIIAKVTRDRIMQKMHQKYPDYGFDLHKGYGTSLHVANLKKFGPCKIHRKTFWPVSSFLN